MQNAKFAVSFLVCGAVPFLLHDVSCTASSFGIQSGFLTPLGGILLYSVQLKLKK